MYLCIIAHSTESKRSSYIIEILNDILAMCIIINLLFISIIMLLLLL